MSARSRGSSAAAPARVAVRLRARWRDRPGAGLRAAAALYGLGHDLRDFLYDAGVLPARRAPVPVISVGGLTAGGSGKTPIAAEVARWLREAAWRPALVTAGLADEMDVLDLLAPGVPVEGGRDRQAATRRAAGGGADVAVLDSGFQHRGLARALDLVCVDRTSWSLPGRHRLPAGPFRERAGALERADAVVLVERGKPGTTAALEVRASVRRRAPGGRLAICRLQPVGFRAANERATSRPPGPRSVVAAGVMWPEGLFEAARALGLAAEAELAFADHEAFGPARLAELVEAGAAGGVVCSLKDAVKLGPLLADRLAVWYVEERPVWVRGGDSLRRAVLRRAAGAAGRPPSMARAERR
jgi:tetraacyldisaccharide 4'-kinase